MKIVTIRPAGKTDAAGIAKIYADYVENRTILYIRALPFQMKRVREFIDTLDFDRLVSMNMLDTSLVSGTMSVVAEESESHSTVDERTDVVGKRAARFCLLPRLEFAETAASNLGS